MSDATFPAITTIFPADLPLPLLDDITRRMRAARAVQVVGHVRPDGDCIGSLLGIHWMLSHWGIPHALAVEAMPRNGYDELEGFGLIKDDPDPALKPDLAVYVDCATRARGFEHWTTPETIINIDHHGSNTRYGTVNWIEPTCAAVGEMLFYLARHAGVPIVPGHAEALLIALATDTGSFRFSNTGPRQHIIAAALIEAGASVEHVAKLAFSSHSPESVRLAGYVMSTLRLACEGQLAWSELRRDDYRRFGGENQAPENLADALRSMRGVRLGVLFHELETGGLRLNLRSDGTVNVARLAAEWGGGGHPAAAGMHLNPADYVRDRDRILARCEAVVEGLDKSQ